jgi:hypothetical protein
VHRLIATHAVTVNGRIHGELKDNGGPIPHTLAGYLDRLDGVSRFSVNLWALPPDTSLDSVLLEDWPEHYIQAAGSRERMTVEIRRAGPTGPRHFVVGTMKTIEPSPAEQIVWDEHSTHVYGVEVFTAAEAVTLFVSYWQSGDLPQGYTERLVDL